LLDVLGESGGETQEAFNRDDISMPFHKLGQMLCMQWRRTFGLPRLEVRTVVAFLEQIASEELRWQSSDVLRYFQEILRAPGRLLHIDIEEHGGERNYIALVLNANGAPGERDLVSRDSITPIVARHLLAMGAAWVGPRDRRP
jgi:hypothetical protein